MSRQLLLGAVFFVTFTAQTAWAGVMLVERSFLSGGDRLISYDPISMLEWLDVSYTVNNSFNTMVTRLLPTGDLGQHRWRYATPAEISTLFANNMLVDKSNSAADVASMDAFTALLGRTYLFNGYRHTIGIGDSTSLRIRGVGVANDGFTDVDRIFSGAAVSPSLGQSDIGHWLVRDIVPEPTSIAIWTVAGICAIGFRRRRAGGRCATTRASGML